MCKMMLPVQHVNDKSVCNIILSIWRKVVFEANHCPFFVVYKKTGKKNRDTYAQKKKKVKKNDKKKLPFLLKIYIFHLDNIFA